MPAVERLSGCTNSIQYTRSKLCICGVYSRLGWDRYRIHRTTTCATRSSWLFAVAGWSESSPSCARQSAVQPSRPETEWPLRWDRVRPGAELTLPLASASDHSSSALSLLASTSASSSTATNTSLSVHNQSTCNVLANVSFTARCYVLRAWYCYGKSSGCPSVHPCVCRWRWVSCYIGWNTSKIILRFVRSLQTPTSPIYSKETPRNFGHSKNGVWKKSGFWCAKSSNISETGQDTTMVKPAIENY